VRLLTISEVSDVLRVPRARTYALVRRGLLPRVYVGRQVRVPEVALKAWIANGGDRLGSSITPRGSDA
jgi:excisionase family DNA binding protein